MSRHRVQAYALYTAKTFTHVNVPISEGEHEDGELFSRRYTIAVRGVLANLSNVNSFRGTLSRL